MNILSFFFHIITWCSSRSIVLLLKCLSRFFDEYSLKKWYKRVNFSIYIRT